MVFMQNVVKYVSDIPLRSLPSLSADTPMYDVLQLFKTGRAHMALLYAPLPDGETPLTTCIPDHLTTERMAITTITLVTRTCVRQTRMQLLLCFRSLDLWRCRGRGIWIERMTNGTSL